MRIIYRGMGTMTKDFNKWFKQLNIPLDDEEYKICKKVAHQAWIAAKYGDLPPSLVNIQKHEGYKNPCYLHDLDLDEHYLDYEDIF